jgi:hypothetical protein
METVDLRHPLIKFIEPRLNQNVMLLTSPMIISMHMCPRMAKKVFFIVGLLLFMQAATAQDYEAISFRIDSRQFLNRDNQHAMHVCA